MTPLPLGVTSATQCHLCRSPSARGHSFVGNSVRSVQGAFRHSLGPVGSSKSRAGRQLRVSGRSAARAPRQARSSVEAMPAWSLCCSQRWEQHRPSKRAHRQWANTKNGLGSRGLRQRLCYRLSPRHSSSSSRIEASFPPSLPPSCPPSLPPSLSPSLSPLSTRVCVSLSHSHTLLLLHHHQYRHHHHHHHHHHHNNNNNNNNKNNNNLFLVF